MERFWDIGTVEAGPPVVGPPARVDAVREDAVEWAQRELGFTADALQARVLRSESRRGMLNCARQWGKSTVTGVKALYQGVREAGSLTLVLSPCARQSAEFLRKVEGFAKKLGIAPKGDGDNEISLALPNGSRIVGLPGTEATVRGFSAVALLLVDEAARVSDALYYSVRPMLAVSDGALWLMSTPNGKKGFFYEEWANGGDVWERVQATAAECPRIPKSFLAGEERGLSERWFRQEYLCSFEDSLSGMFDRALIEKAFSSEFGVLEV